MKGDQDYRHHNANGANPAADNAEENDQDKIQSSYPFTKIHTNLPFFDFKKAELSLGVDFELISADGFKGFLEDKYLKTLVDLRKAYFKKDMKSLKETAHTIKGAFS